MSTRVEATTLAPRVDLLTDAAFVLVGTALVAGAAQISVSLPFTPVPITGQTFAVLLVGATLGTVRGTSSLLLYVLVGIAGAPIYAHHAHGWAVVTSASGPVFGVNFEPQPGFKSGVAVDPEGNIYMANRDTKKIEVFESAGGPPFRLIPLPKRRQRRTTATRIRQAERRSLRGHRELHLPPDRRRQLRRPGSSRYETGAGDEMAIDAEAGIIYTPSSPNTRPSSPRAGAPTKSKRGATLEMHVVATGTENQAKYRRRRIRPTRSTRPTTRTRSSRLRNGARWLSPT